MPKRGENIRKRKDGRWEARIKTESGKLRSVYAKTYSELKAKLKDTNEKQRLGNLRLFEPKTPFLSLTESFLKESEIKNKKSTVSRYREIAENHLIPFFKNTPINSESVNTFILYKLNHEKLEAKTVYDIVSVLVQIMKHGNITFEISRPALYKKELDVLTESEQERLVKLIKPCITYENIGILLSLYSGMRLGEICALLWKDIDLEEKTISITKAMQRISVKDKERKTMIIIDVPKTQKSIRKIPIPDFLIPELKRLSSSCSPDSYVLTGSDSYFIEPRLYQYKFKKYLKQSQIRDTNFHALRHTFATRAIEQKIDIKAVSEILGHSTVSFTLERYVHISFEFKKQNIEKLTVCY